MQALAHLVGDEEDADPVERRARGRKLGEHVLAGRALGDHALQAAHLALDAPQAIDHLVELGVGGAAAAGGVD